MKHSDVFDLLRKRISIIPEVTKIDAMDIDTKINVSEEGFMRKRTVKKDKQYILFPSYDCSDFFVLPHTVALK